MNRATERLIAYFSMEIAVESSMPTYSGGLGVLAGDTIRTAADMEVPMGGVTLLHRKGYFTQRIDGNGRCGRDRRGRPPLPIAAAEQFGCTQRKQCESNSEALENDEIFFFGGLSPRPRPPLIQRADFRLARPLIRKRRYEYTQCDSKLGLTFKF